MNCYVFAAHPKTFACLAALKRFVFCFAMVPMCRALLQSRKPLVWLARLPHKDEVMPFGQGDCDWAISALYFHAI